jgi:pyruvate-ferredoxin/flavodoxin oxidoreductase
MAEGMQHQKAAVESGYWPLYRYDPRLDPPFQLDSRAPKRSIHEFEAGETRFTSLGRTNPDVEDALEAELQHETDERWALYEHLAELRRHTVP